MAINQIVQLMGLPQHDQARSQAATAAPTDRAAPEPEIEARTAPAARRDAAGTSGRCTNPDRACGASAPPSRSSNIEPPAPRSLEPQPLEKPQPKPLPEARDEHGNRIGLESPVTVISGIGPAIAEKLERLGVKTIRDLLVSVSRAATTTSAISSPSTVCSLATK